MTQIASPVTPDLRAILDGLKQEILYSLNCHEVGIIESFDMASQSASVRIAVLRNTPDGAVPYPLLTDCPVYFPGGGSAYMTFPVKKGDSCLVLFNDRDLDKWYTTGNVTAPNSARAHSLSDGMVLVGIRHRGMPPNLISLDSVRIWNGQASIGINNAGIVSLEATDGAVIQLDDKTQISNPTGTLLMAVNALCTALTAWVNTGGSTPNPATIAAVNAAKAKFDAILL